MSAFAFAIALGCIALGVLLLMVLAIMWIERTELGENSGIDKDEND